MLVQMRHSHSRLIQMENIFALAKWITKYEAMKRHTITTSSSIICRVYYETYYVIRQIKLNYLQCVRVSLVPGFVFNMKKLA